jgi:hypothetical protein
VRQETLLAILWQERTSRRSSTREAVLRLMHPIRGIQMMPSRANTGYADGLINMKWGESRKSNRLCPRRIQTPGQFHKLT